MTAGTRVDRERIGRILTFWLRPAFVLRVLGRFQRVAGFDRAIALASGALTALVSLAIIASAILPRVDARDVAHTIIARYGLTGRGAQAVRDVFSPAGGTSTDLSLLGVFLLLVAVLSFSRGVQRLVEQTWELRPLSVRNTLNDLVWIIGLVCFVAFSWWIRSLIDDSRLQVLANLVFIIPGALFLAWSGRVLSARRIPWRSLVPFAIVGAALLALAAIGSAAYVPHLFSSYASRYGAIGAVLAMISALFALMLVVVASAVIGREVADELDRIRRGERPPEDEVRREWAAILDGARSRWQSLRDRVEHVRHHR